MMASLTIQADCLQRRIVMAPRLNLSPAPAPSPAPNPACHPRLDRPSAATPVGTLATALLEPSTNPQKRSDLCSRTQVPPKKFSFDFFESYLGPSRHGSRSSSPDSPSSESSPTVQKDTSASTLAGLMSTPEPSVDSRDASFSRSILSRQSKTKANRASKKVTFSKTAMVKDYDPFEPVQPRSASSRVARRH